MNKLDPTEWAEWFDVATYTIPMPEVDLEAATRIAFCTAWIRRAMLEVAPDPWGFSKTNVDPLAFGEPFAEAIRVGTWGSREERIAFIAGWFCKAMDAAKEAGPYDRAA